MSGFCTYNDVALAVHEAVTHYRLRVAYIDLDAHHGDGVQDFFYDSGEVMTISVHESGRYLFPGTGFTYEVGRGAGRGLSVKRTARALYRRRLVSGAFRGCVAPRAGGLQARPDRASGRGRHAPARPPKQPAPERPRDRRELPISKQARRPLLRRAFGRYRGRPATILTAPCRACGRCCGAFSAVRTRRL